MTKESDFFSIRHPGEMFNKHRREKKAETILAVLNDYYGVEETGRLKILDIGASTGIIANYLASYVSHVTGIDVDQNAIEFAKKKHYNSNVEFYICDAIDLMFENSSFDVVICCNVYEHVSDAKKMINEIHRILKKGGICYLTAPNRFNIIERHYYLPLLSVIPKPLAHVYIRIAKNKKKYDVNHFSFWDLRKLVSEFKVIDYTKNLIFYPEKFFTDYMITPGTIKFRLAKFIVCRMYWLCPSYIWLLKKK